MSTTPMADLLRSQTSAPKTEPTGNSSKIIEREPIDKTPFTLVTTEKGSFITLGKFKLTEERDTKDEALQELHDNNWKIVMAVVSITIEETIRQLTETARSMNTHNNLTPQRDLEQLHKEAQTH